MPANRRDQERFSLNLQARISSRHSNNDTEVETVAANISAGGAFLNTNHRLPLASKVTVQFYISVTDLEKLKFVLSTDSLRKISQNHTWVTTTGVVIRSENDGVGVIFDTDYQITPV